MNPYCGQRHLSRSARFIDAALLVLTFALLRHLGLDFYSAYHVTTFPVTGQLLVNGQAAESATVVLHPLSHDGLGHVTPSGTVDADGYFRVKTGPGRDGAPVGNYAVTIHYSPRVVTDQSSSRGWNVFPQRFARPSTTPLRANVTEGHNRLPVFNVELELRELLASQSPVILD
jgi:hypothetical protein